MAEAVYVLCALTSLGCAILLLRQWWSAKARLLMWSALCFICLFFNNVLLVIDKIVFPAIPMSSFVKVPALIGLAIFLFGLIWEDE